MRYKKVFFHSFKDSYHQIFPLSFGDCVGPLLDPLFPIHHWFVNCSLSIAALSIVFINRCFVNCSLSIAALSIFLYQSLLCQTYQLLLCQLFLSIAALSIVFINFWFKSSTAVSYQCWFVSSSIDHRNCHQARQHTSVEGSQLSRDPQEEQWKTLTVASFPTATAGTKYESKREYSKYIVYGTAV